MKLETAMMFLVASGAALMLGCCMKGTTKEFSHRVAVSNDNPQLRLLSAFSGISSIETDSSFVSLSSELLELKKNRLTDQRANLSTSMPFILGKEEVNKADYNDLVSFVSDLQDHFGRADDASTADLFAPKFTLLRRHFNVAQIVLLYLSLFGHNLDGLWHFVRVLGMMNKDKQF